MDAIEKRTRFEEWAKAKGLIRILDGGRVESSSLELLFEAFALGAALTPPEGYVLVPVELPVEMEIAFMEAWVSKRRCIDDPEMQDAWATALAARPEVS